MKLFASEWNVVWFKVLLVIQGWPTSGFHSSNLWDLGPGFIPLRNSFKIYTWDVMSSGYLLFLKYWSIILHESWEPLCFPVLFVCSEMRSSKQIAVMMTCFDSFLSVYMAEVLKVFIITSWLGESSTSLLFVCIFFPPCPSLYSIMHGIVVLTMFLSSFCTSQSCFKLVNSCRLRMVFVVLALHARFWSI
jgi:hypothetical protein